MPVEIPVTTPPVLTVAVPLPLLHVPPETVEESVIAPHVHTVDGPEMVPAEGVVFTVTRWVATLLPQVLLTVYDTRTSPPAIPDTTPVALTVAAPEPDHAPPIGVPESVMELPTHTAVGPETEPGVGTGSTVTL